MLFRVCGCLWCTYSMCMGPSASCGRSSFDDGLGRRIRITVARTGHCIRIIPPCTTKFGWNVVCGRQSAVSRAGTRRVRMWLCIPITGCTAPQWKPMYKYCLNYGGLDCSQAMRALFQPPSSHAARPNNRSKRKGCASR